MKSKALKIFAVIFCLFAFINVSKAEDLNELFNKIAPNGTINVPAIVPNGELEVEDFSSSYIRKEFNTFGYLTTCNEDYSKCTLYLGNEDNNITKEVNVIWQKGNAVAKTIIDTAIKLIKLKPLNFEGSVVYDLDDLNLLNYIVNTTGMTDEETIDLPINYVNELKKAFEYSNITYNTVFRAGDAGLFYEYGLGELVLWYKGVINGEIAEDIDVGVVRNHIIYIPSDTENTPEAYMAAAKKRIDGYLGNNDTTIEIGGKRSEVSDHEYSKYSANVITDDEMGEYYYKITIAGNAYNFLIVRDTAKMVVSNFINKDIETNIKVTNPSIEVPFDATLDVAKIISGTQEYENIVNALKTDTFAAYDIKLHSDTKDSNITKVNSNFTVSIPITDELKNQDLVVYYIKEDGALEKYDVEVDEDGYANFQTNHFSTYILAKAEKEEKEEIVPQTGDNIYFYSVIGLISLISVAFVTIKRQIKD